MAAPSLFATIHDLGTRLCDALRRDRFETAAALVQERDLLVERLKAFNHPSEVDPNWPQWQDKLAAQDKAIQRVLTRTSEQLHATMQQVRNVSNAHTSYQRQSAPATTVLHRRLSA